MISLFTYSLTMAIVLLILMPVYYVTMSRLQCHKVNRMILLAIALIGIGIYPFIAFPDHSASGNAQKVDMWALVMLASQQSDSTMAMTSPSDNLDMTFRIIAWTFIGGVIVMACTFMKTWLKVAHLIYKGEKRPFDSYILVVVNTSSAPFSFGKFIVMNQNDYNEHNPMILAHEKKHLSAGHTWDLLLCQIILIMNWYNPAAWSLMSALRTVHEYQADKAVLDCGMNAAQYQLMLIKKAVGTRFPSVTNSLSHSKLKKRITMMLSSKNGSSARWRAMAMVPAVALALVVVNHPAVATTMEQMKSVNLFGQDNSKDKDSESLDNSLSLESNSDRVKKTSANVIFDNGTIKSVPVTNQTADAPVIQNGDIVVTKISAVPKSEFTCTGKVTDDAGTPMPGVIVKTTKGATITDTNGDFSLKTDQFSVAKIMYVGYETKKMSLNRSHMGTIALSKSDTDEDYSDRIGGQNCHYIPDTTTVVYVDGVKCDRIDDLNPQDIESMTVVKDDHPAVIITTKKSGSKPNGKWTMIINGTSIDLSEIPEITEASSTANTQIVITDNDNETIIDVETKDGNRTRNRTINKTKK